jgi:UDP-N-acetylglucosamine:LPS N-acetylglucosamine transferase
MLRQDRIDHLQPLVTELLADAARREAMKAALANLRRPTAAEDIADLIATTAGARTKVPA